MHPHRAFLFALAIGSATCCAAAQDLHKALVDADVVAVARQVGRTRFSDAVDLHRLQIVDTLRGRAAPTLLVIDWPGLSVHNRPAPRQTRLYCLADATREAQRIGLPADQGPYYRMSGHAGSNPLVGADLAADPVVAFARLLTSNDRNTAPDATAARIVDFALGTDPALRLEATRHITAQPLLRTRLTRPQWGRLLDRASAESEDIAYKVALAELCCEQNLDGTVDALILGLDTVHDREYVRAVGRICAALRADDAATPLLRRLQSAANPQTRAALVVALGCTRTGPALDALMQMKQAHTDETAVDAALSEHGSQRAKDAILRGGSKDAK